MAAIDRFPDGLALYETAIAALFDANQPDKVVALARRAIDRFGRLPLLAWSEAAALDEQDDRAAARVAFDVVGRPVDNAQAVWRIRHLLRRGDIGEAAAEVETRLGQGDAAALWPYAALCWRALGDARSHWLERDGELVADIDLGLAPHEIDAIVTLLRQLHRRSGRFLDQSVRHGTQTDGPLLARIDPPIMMLRERLRLAVRDYVAALPPGEPSHPLLGQRRDTWPRFAGSWSVRLGDQGFHRAHHHPQGWISSACYMVVPDGLATGIGALELGGAPAGLGLDVAPERAIQPVAGRLALFPSTMWHSTTPFPAGERITVAFDVARPLFCR